MEEKDGKLLNRNNIDRRKTFAYGAPNKLLDQNEKIDKRKILKIFK